GGAGEVLWAAVSFWKWASKGWRGGVLRQLAGPTAAVGAAISNAANAAQVRTAHVRRVRVRRIARIVTVRIGPAMLSARAARFPAPSFGRALLARAMATRLF